MYDITNYPHPVLGVDDSVDGSCDVTLKVASDREKTTLTVNYGLNNSLIADLVDRSKAEFATHIYCSSTMYRECFRAERGIEQVIEIPSADIRDLVEAHFFVIAATDISGYRDASFHADYGEVSFQLDRGDVLASGGRARFFANKRPEELASISSLMNVNRSKEKTGIIRNEYDGDKITILLPGDDYEKYQELRYNKFSVGVLHGSLVLPALIDAIIQARKDEFDDRRWHKIINELLLGDTESDPLVSAQKILDAPVNRSLLALGRLLDSE